MMEMSDGIGLGSVVPRFRAVCRRIYTINMVQAEGVRRTEHHASVIPRKPDDAAQVKGVVCRGRDRVHVTNIRRHSDPKRLRG